MSEQCPYCNSEIEINHDDGYGYEEDGVYQQECRFCKKNFVFRTTIHFSYDLDKADCLNGAEHNFRPTVTYPKEATRMRCLMCNDERSCTADEMQSVLKGATDGK